MSRTIRWARDTQKQRLKYFNDRFVDRWFPKREQQHLNNYRWYIWVNPGDTKEGYSKELRRDGKRSTHTAFYKEKRTRERRSFERQQLNLILRGKKEHFDEVFEKDKEWMD